MSKIRKKLERLHRPLSQKRQDIENFPVDYASSQDAPAKADDSEVESSAEPRQTNAVSAPIDRSIKGASRASSGSAQPERSSHPPTRINEKLRRRLDRLMSVAAKASPAKTVASTSQRASARQPHSDVAQKEQPRRAKRAEQWFGQKSAHASANARAEENVATSGGFTVSQRAFERWKRQKDAEGATTHFVRPRLQVDRDSGPDRKPAADISRPERRVSRGEARSSNQKQAFDQGRETTGAEPSPDSSRQLSKLESSALQMQSPEIPARSAQGDDQYLKASRNFSRVSATDVLEQILDSLEAGLSPRVRSHAIRTLAATAEATGNVHYAIAAYDMMSAERPSDALPHRELARLYRVSAVNQRRARYHERRAAELAPWDGALSRARGASEALEDDDIPFDA